MNAVDGSDHYDKVSDGKWLKHLSSLLHNHIITNIPPQSPLPPS